MCRRLSLALAIGWAAATTGLWMSAAPFNGSLTIDMVLSPSDDENPVNVKFESDLLLALSIGSLEIISFSVLTFQGPEFQVFSVEAPLAGVLIARDMIIFAPNLVEIEQQRNFLGLPVYCISFADPAIPLEIDATLPIDTGLPACPVTADNDLAAAEFYHLIEGGADLARINDSVHPVLANLTFARIFEGAGHLDQALSLRKKVVDLKLSLGVFQIGLRGLFANLGSSSAPKWRTGLIARAEVQVLDTLTIQSETWIRASEGLECFAECKPLQRIHGGGVNYRFIQQKLSIRSVTIAGIVLGTQAAFSFNGSTIGLQFLELTQQFNIACLINVFSTIKVGYVTFNSINVLSQTILMHLRIDEITATAVFHLWPMTGSSAGIRFHWSRLVTTWDTPHVKITSDIQVCKDADICGTLPSVLTHDLYLTALVGGLTIEIRVSFDSLIMNFRQAAADLNWELGKALLKSSTIVNEGSLAAQLFSFTFRF